MIMPMLAISADESPPTKAASGEEESGVNGGVNNHSSSSLSSHASSSSSSNPRAQISPSAIDDADDDDDAVSSSSSMQSLLSHSDETPPPPPPPQPQRPQSPIVTNRASYKKRRRHTPDDSIIGSGSNSFTTNSSSTTTITTRSNQLAINGNNSASPSSSSSSATATSSNKLTNPSNATVSSTLTRNIDDESNVKVAVRIRPQLTREKIEMCKICTNVTPGEPQVSLGHKEDKSFTFDYVFDQESAQEEVYSKCVEELVDACFEGYNATVLAYGQTGSGKTYTMGTSFDTVVAQPSLMSTSSLSRHRPSDDEGLIPRAIAHLFDRIESRSSTGDLSSYSSSSLSPAAPKFTVLVQFMELYNEEINDLFAALPSTTTTTTNLFAASTLTAGFTAQDASGAFQTTEQFVFKSTTVRSNRIEIHEDHAGGINVQGCSTHEVRSANETLEKLRLGARIRTTGATNMNLTSSRSHAIFTIHLKQTRAIRSTAMVTSSSDEQQNGDSSVSGYCSLSNDETGNGGNQEFETLNAKFHFVDLAGSERLKRTGATGHRAKEGISINRGLLALGNVISALGDKEKRGSHVPYRDSKLTRLLQDSLGGNSKTLMIACISPSDRDFMETLNTLRYANRARNIKNKVHVNQDKTSKQIAQLKAEIERLSYELMQFKSRYHYHHHPGTPTSGGTVKAFVFPKSDTANSISSSRTTSTVTIVSSAAGNASTNLLAASSFAESRRSSTEFLTILNDLKQENSLLLKENQSMRLRIRAMQETVETVRGRNADLECRNHGLAHRMTKLRSRIAFAKDRFTAESSEINEFFDSLADETNNEAYNNDENNEKIYDYLKEIEDLRSKLNESESMCKHLQQAYHRATNNTSQMMMMKNNHYHQDSTSTNQLNDSRSSSLLVLRGQHQQTELGNSTNELLEEAKNDVETDLSRLRSLQSKLNEIATVDCSSSTADDNDECDVVLTNITDSDINGSETNKQQLNDQSKSGSDNKQQLETSLDELQSKIDIKRRLINELEINTRSLEVMRVHYEEKMSLLHERIKQMEDERDRVIFNMTKLNQDNKYDDQIRKIKVEYEVKLRTLQTDLAKYEQIKTKNAQMLKNALETEKQLEQLRKEIVDMKKLKVKLMNQLKDETHKSKMEEQRRQREIAALKRDHLRKDNQIRSLEAEKRCREIVLKRKQEEIQALRKHNNGRVMSEKASGRTTSASNPTTTLTGMISEEMAVATSTTSRFINGQSRATMSKSANDSHHHPPPPAPASSYMTKRKAAYMQKWQKFDDTISAIIVKKQTISLIEREMERFLEQREKIGRKLNRLMKKLEKAMSSEAAAAAALEAQKESSNSLLTAATTTSSTNSDINNKSSSSTCFEPSSSNNTASNCSNAAVAVSVGSKVDELREQIDIMKSNIDYLQDQIAECQTNIIQLDEAKDGCDYMNLESLIQTICSIEEAKFVLKKLLIVALNKGIAAAQKEHLSNELECELEQIEKDYYVQQQVVQQMINSGQISNEFVQQILLYNQPCKPMAQPNNNSSTSTSSGTNGGGGGDSDQPRMMPICNPVMMNGCSSDNFEIDEIILAPMIEDSTSESEDEDEEMTKLVESGDDAATSHLKSYENVINPLTPVSATFRGIKPPSIMQTMNSQVNPTAATTATTTTINQFNSSSSTSTTSSSNNSGGVQVATASIMVGGGDNHSTSSSSSVSYKARQMTTNGPQDFLYISTMAATVTNQQVNTVNDNSTSSPQQQQLTSPPSNLVQTSRICSKSYTKIPEVVANSSGSSGSSGSNSKAYVPPTIPPVPLTTSNRASLSKQQLNMTGSGINTDLLMMNGMSMSRSVIVTAADAAANNSAAKAGYNRMTMSSISRQNSKDSVISISPPDSPCYGGGHHHSGTVGHQKRSTHHSVSSGRDGSRDYHYDTSDSNVFKRLTAGDVHKKQAPAPEHGLIKPYSGNTNRFKTAPVTLTHVAEGHSKAVLALDSYDGALLFTGSKDRTAKVWDLATGAEIASLSAGHTNHVTRVRFCPVTRLCFTVSSYYVNVWDLRVPTANKCIKTLCSSGLANDGEAIVSQVKPNSRILHNEIPFGEKIINDLVADKNGHDLYVAAGETVKIWDLKQFQPVGNLSTGHSASISTLLVDDNMIITGSKDHYIKIFEANKMNGSLQYHHQSQQYSSNMTSSSSLVLNSKHNLTPPHYDGVQSLCLVDSQLFSCSRDMCIKKWSLIDFQCKQSINNCHKDWIRSLDYMRNYNNTDLLISGCRGGYLKFWNINTLEKLADFKAHLCPINSIKVSNNLVFTASDDATVRIWKRN